MPGNVRVAGLRTGITAEGLVERLFERRRKSDLASLAEGCQHILRDRIGSASARLRGLDVDRLDVQEPAAYWQRQKVAHDDLRPSLFEEVEGGRNL